MIITVAWVQPSREPVNLETRRADLGEPVQWRDTFEARACTWSLDGTAEDLRKAEAWAAKPDHGYPCVAQTWERMTPDLLDRARKLALKTLAPTR